LLRAGLGRHRHTAAGARSLPTVAGLRGLSSDNRGVAVGDVDRVVKMVEFDAERVVADDQLA
jgi:hypothetical protein